MLDSKNLVWYMHIKNSGHCTELGIQYINVCSMIANDLSCHKILSVASGLWVDEFYKLRLQMLQPDGGCQVLKSPGSGDKPVSGSFSGASVMEQGWCQGSRSPLSSALIYTGNGMGVAGCQGGKRIILTPWFFTWDTKSVFFFFCSAFQIPTKDSLQVYYRG